MSAIPDVVTHPIALISVALAAVFAFGARRNGQSVPTWWPVACYSLAFLVVIGGFLLAWQMNPGSDQAASRPSEAVASSIPLPVPAASEPTGTQTAELGRIEQSKVTFNQSAISGASKPLKQTGKASDVKGSEVKFNQIQ